MENSLAIIIPYYKISFFEETLESLVLQTNKHFKVYIGNDASPENPEELLKKYKGKFDFIYKKFDENLGSTSLTKQWERCIEMMEDEEWFMILGDDDFLSNNVVEEFYANIDEINKHTLNVIKLNSAVIDDNNKVLKEKKDEPKIKSVIEHFFDKFIHEGRSSLSEHIFRKTKWEKYGFADLPLAWHSDDLAVLEFSEYENVFFIEKAKCYVRIWNKSITGNTEINIKEKRQATKLFFELVCGNLARFNIVQKKKLFHLIEWHENNKQIKINIPSRFLEFCKVFGWRGIVKYYKP